MRLYPRSDQALQGFLNLAYERRLPTKYVGYTRCYGSDLRGLPLCVCGPTLAGDALWGLPRTHSTGGRCSARYVHLSANGDYNQEMDLEK